MFLETEIIYGIKVVDVIVAMAYLLIGFILGHLISTYVRRALRTKAPEYSEYIGKISFYSILGVFVLAALISMGAEKYVSGIILAGGILGVILGFASQQAVSNMISGLFLIIDRPITVGDPVEVENVSGIVTDISLLSTKIRTWDGKLVRIPNSTVFQAKIANFAKHKVRRIDLKVGVSYKEDLDKVVKILEDIVEKHPLILSEPQPTIFAEEFGESSINISVRVWVPVKEWFNVKTQLVALIKKRFDEEGVEIPYPQLDVWFRSPLRTIHGKDTT